MLIAVIPKRHVRVFEMNSSCCLCQLRCLQRVTGGVRLGTEAGLVPWGGFWWGWPPPGQGCCCACRWEAQDSSLGLRCLWFAERCGDLSLPRLCRSHCIVQGSHAGYSCAAANLVRVSKAEVCATSHALWIFLQQQWERAVLPAQSVAGFVEEALPLQ